MIIVKVIKEIQMTEIVFFIESHGELEELVIMVGN